MTEVILSGYYGYDNIGDEAILYSLITGLQETNPDLNLTVLSAAPSSTARRYRVRAVARFSPWQVHTSFQQADILISGGGSLLQDATSWRSPLYYLGLIRLAHFYSMKTIFCCQGVGPLNRQWLQDLVASTVKSMDRISVRDPDSRELLSELGVDSARITVLDDPVFLLQDWSEAVEPDSGSAKDNYSGLPQDFSADCSEAKLLGVAVRPWSDNSYLWPLADALEKFLRERENFKLLLLPFHGSQDLNCSKKLLQRLDSLSQERILLLDPLEDPREVIKVYRQLDLLLGVRLHSLIFAVLTGVPPVGIEYDPKIPGFLQRLDLEPACRTSDASPDSIYNHLSQTWQKRQQIQENLKDYREAACRRLRDFLTGINRPVKS